MLGGMRRRATAGLAAIGAVGPLGYVLLTVVLGLAQAGYDPVRDTQSELGAVDAPFGTAMNVVGFMGLGLAILAFAGAYVLALRSGWATWSATGLLAVAGVGMVIVGFFPCDPGCVDVTATGRLHGVFSMPGAVGLPAAAMVSAWVFSRDPRFGRGWPAGSFVVGVLSLASGPLIQAGITQDANGLLQRLGMWPALLWMSLVSARLLRLATSASSTAA
jgi:hypothetical protein